MRAKVEDAADQVVNCEMLIEDIDGDWNEMQVKTDKAILAAAVRKRAAQRRSDYFNVPDIMDFDEEYLAKQEVQ